MSPGPTDPAPASPSAPAGPPAASGSAAASEPVAPSERARASRPSPRREHLLAVARDLFARHGYRAVGIDTVLAEAGVAKMTLYKHFRSKEALIAAVLAERSAAIGAALTARVEAAADPRAALLAVFDWLEEWFRSPGFHGCLFLKAAGEYPEPADLPRRQAEQFKAACGALLERLCRELDVSEPEALARQLQLLVEGAIVLADLRRDPVPAADARQAAETLIRGARDSSLPRPTPPPRTPE